MVARRLEQPRPGDAAPGVARISRALSRDDSCPNWALMLFDQPGFAGNVLCIVRTQDSLDGDDLRFYFRLFDRTIGNVGWDRAVRSYLGGEDPGYFRGPDSPYPAEDFFAWQNASSVSSTVANASVLFLRPDTDKPPLSIQFFASGNCPLMPATLLVTMTSSRTGATQFQNASKFTPDDCLYVLPDVNAPAAVRWGETTNFQFDGE